MPHFPLEPRFQALRDLVGLGAAQVAVQLDIDLQGGFGLAHVFDYDRLVIVCARPEAAPRRNRPRPEAAPWLARSVSVLVLAGAPEAEEVAALAPFLSRFAEILVLGFGAGAGLALGLAALLSVPRLVLVAPPDPPVEPEVWTLADPTCARRGPPSDRTLALPFCGPDPEMMLRLLGLEGLLCDLILTGRIDRAALYAGLRRRRDLALYRQRLRALLPRHPSVQRRLHRLFLDEETNSPKKNDAFASQTE